MASSRHFADGAPPAAERSWRLADALAASSVGWAFGRRKDDGTNIEGIAVVGDRLLAGLRTPVVDGAATIVSAPVAALFAPGDAPLDPAVVESVRVSLGTNAGIRDMAGLGPDRLLILSGPAHSEADVPYRLWLATPSNLAATPRLLATVTEQPDITGEMPKARGYGGAVAKAEAVAVLAADANQATVLVMYDNVDEGWPTRFTLDLRER